MADCKLCGKIVVALGLCSRHYANQHRAILRKQRPPNPPRNFINAGKTCSHCTRPAHSRGMCQPHYMRQHRGRPMEIIPMAKNKGMICSKCNKPAHTGGMCQSHYRNP